MKNEEKYYISREVFLGWEMEAVMRQAAAHFYKYDEYRRAVDEYLDNNFSI